MASRAGGADAATIEREDQVVAKVSRRLIWFLFVMYIFSYLDRINTSFAALTMNRDLMLSATAFGMASTIFSIGYLIFDVPSNLMLARTGARIWLPRIMITWGVASAATSLAVGPISLYVIRFIVGAAEAGFLAGVLLYLSYWFPASHRGRATGVFMAAAPFTIVIGAPISGLFLNMHGFLGLAGWRWLFLLEGAPSVIVGVIAYFYLSDRPRTAPWLSDDEKDLLEGRIARERAAEPAAGKTDSIWRELASPTVLALCLAYFCIVTTVNTNAVWAPQIVAAMMKSTGGFAGGFVGVGLITALPSLVALVVLPLWTLRSDRRQERTWHTVAALAAAALGWVLVLVSTEPLFRLPGLILMTAGAFTAMAVFWTIPTMALSSRASPAGIGLISSAGIAASIITPLVVGVLKDRMGNFTGGVTYALALLVVCIVVVLALRPRRPVGAVAAPAPEPLA